MWRGARVVSGYLRRFSTAVRRRMEDEGDWLYSSEWWGSDSDDGHSVLRSTSGKGNGVVAVVAYPSSRPVSFLSLSLNVFVSFKFCLHEAFYKFPNELEISDKLNYSKSIDIMCTRVSN